MIIFPVRSPDSGPMNRPSGSKDRMANFNQNYSLGKKQIKIKDFSNKFSRNQNSKTFKILTPAFLINFAFDIFGINFFGWLSFNFGLGNLSVTIFSHLVANDSSRVLSHHLMVDDDEPSLLMRYYDSSPSQRIS